MATTIDAEGANSPLATYATLPTIESAILRPYDVMPDGRSFLAISSENSEESALEPRNFHVVLNWTERLKELVPIP
jgi:hypothetical protein